MNQQQKKWSNVQRSIERCLEKAAFADEIIRYADVNHACADPDSLRPLLEALKEDLTFAAANLKDIPLGTIQKPAA